MISTIQFNIEKVLALDEAVYILGPRISNDKISDGKCVSECWNKFMKDSKDGYDKWVESSGDDWKVERYDIINHLIKKYNYLNYLEIGICDGATFSKIDIEHKDGVDPNPLNAEGERLTNYRISSDDFFDLIRGHDIKYDIIFIDGLHHDYQVYRDIMNSLNHLTADGTIVCHDMNPLFEVTQLKRSFVGAGMWNGDCWKAWAKLRTENVGVEMKVVDTDHGVGIIRFGKQELFDTSNVQHLLQPKDKSAMFLLLNEHRKELLNLISVDEFFKEYKL